MNRRHFLHTLSSAAALTALPLRAQNLSSQKRFLIVVVARGGMDQTMSLDAKAGSPFVDSAPGEIALLGGLPILAHPSRPMSAAFFRDFGDRVAIVNGLQVRTLVHESGIRRVLTGDPTGTKPDVAAIVADQSGRSLPVPYLALGASALPGPFVGLSGRTGAIGQVGGLIDPATEFPVVGHAPIASMSSAEENLITGFLRRRARNKTQGRVGRIAKQIREYDEGVGRIASFKRFAKDAFSEREYNRDLEVQSRIAVNALADGLSQSLMLEVDGFDTHAGGDDAQALAQETLFAGLGSLMVGLEERGLTEKTTVLVVSELGRTPKKNNDDGKDHWSVASAMVLGGGVRSGVYGATDDGLGAMPIDMRSGVADPAGSQLQPGNLLAGVLALAGVAPTEHLAAFQPLTALIA